jgi:uncharacterized protein (DUF433 family)
MAAISPAVAHHRARVAALARAVRAGERPAADLDDARRNLAALRLEEYVQKIITDWPPLSPEQLERITGLLTAGGSDGTA